MKLKQYRSPLVKSVYQKNIFLISQPKHMLWVLKSTISMRRFFWAPKIYVEIDGKENIYNCTLKIFVYLNLWYRLSMVLIIKYDHWVLRYGSRWIDRWRQNNNSTRDYVWGNKFNMIGCVKCRCEWQFKPLSDCSLIYPYTVGEGLSTRIFRVNIMFTKSRGYLNVKNIALTKLKHCRINEKREKST